MSYQRKTRWKKTRTAVASADSDLSASTKKWTTIWATHKANLCKADYSDTRMEFRFRFSTLAATTCDFKVYAMREDGDAQFAFSGTAYAGSMLAGGAYEISGAANTYYADKINIADDGLNLWPSLAASSCEDDTGDNEMATVLVRTLGRRYFLILVTAIAGGGTVEIDTATYDE